MSRCRTTRRRGIWVLGIALTVAVPAAAEDAALEPPGEGPPRTLILSLDGVAWTVVEAAAAQGAFTGWPEPRPLVSTFPSMTNIAFNAIFSPLRHDRMDGYEMRHYDWSTNRVLGGSAHYAERSGAWRDHYDLMHNSVVSKAQAYLSPRSDIRSTLKEIERVVLEGGPDVIVAHIKGTDVLAHFRGNDAVTAMMVELAERLEALAVAHRERHGRALRFLLFSDHGNTERKVYFRRGIQQRLEEAGLRVRDKLERDDDIVAPTYGVVSFGVLFTRPSNAETAARAVVRQEGVDLAAWLVDDGSLRVVGADGTALVRWRGEARSREIAYEQEGGDPLCLGDVTERLRAAGSLDPSGFVPERVWFESTVHGPYPDGPRRLVESLDGTWVRNAATVILSFEPGYAWGRPTVRFGAYLGGGHQEGTHGGLDRGSSLGFIATNDGERAPAGPLPADRALTAWVDLLERPVHDPRTVADADAPEGTSTRD